MLFNSKLIRENPRWLIVVITFGLAVVILPWVGGPSNSRVGIWLGAIGAALILFEVALLPRRLLRRFRQLGSGATWMRAHVWLGLFSVLPIFYHAGISWGGPVTCILMVLYLLAVVSGIVGLILQNVLPKWLLELIPNETYFSSVGAMSESIAKQAEHALLAAYGSSFLPRPSTGPKVADGRSIDDPVTRDLAGAELLRMVFYDDVQPYLLDGRRSKSAIRYSYKAVTLFNELRERAKPEAHALIDAWSSWCEQRRRLDLQSRIRWWLHSWKWIHTPLSIAILLLLFIHVVDVLAVRVEHN